MVGKRKFIVEVENAELTSSNLWNSLTACYSSDVKFTITPYREKKFVTCGSCVSFGKCTRIFVGCGKGRGK